MRIKADTVGNSTSGLCYCCSGAEHSRTQSCREEPPEEAEIGIKEGLFDSQWKETSGGKVKCYYITDMGKAETSWASPLTPGQGCSQSPTCYSKRYSVPYTVLQARKTASPDEAHLPKDTPTCFKSTSTTILFITNGGVWGK